MLNLKSFKIFLLIILIIVVFVILFEKPKTDSQGIVDLAKKLYQEDKAKGLDFSNGPCLTNKLVDDWVVDVAHNPRQPIDNLPENQCADFRQGKAHHFVELDPNGELIRVY